MLKNASSAILAYAVIDLAGANTTVEGELTPFPGADWFKSAPYSPIVTSMGQRLVDEGCGEYSEGPGAQWTESDRKSYECWQKKLGYSGKDADGWPGKGSWDQLKVPLADQSEVGDSSNSSSTATPSSTPTATNTPVPDTSSSSGSSLSGGAIAGIVVGCVVGVGLIGAILFLARRVKRRSTPEAGEDAQERQPEGDGDGDGGAAAVATEESKRSSLEKLPAEAEAIPAKAQTKHFAELPGDLGSSELSETRRINELSDSTRVVEMGEK